MGIAGLSTERCSRRNRLAAERGAISVPLRFFTEPPPPPRGMRRLGAAGTLPGGVDEALARINLALGREGRPLREADVYLLYPEAMNTNFVPDRFLFIHKSTLRNIGREAERGFAFMNSHRTGGMSSPAELPYGWTFAGRYERYVGEGGEDFARTLLGCYMLRGLEPNGSGGPTTDTMFRLIDGGTVRDVSMGLYGGKLVCDVCGGDVYGVDPEGNFVCPHVPGLELEMGDEEVREQRRRGVPDGVATATVVDAHAGEVSAVYDGAVPGSGFRKALMLDRRGGLDARALGQARAAFAPVLRGGAFGRRRRRGPVGDSQPTGGRSRPAPHSPRRSPAGGGGNDMPRRYAYGSRAGGGSVSAAQVFQTWQAMGSPPDVDLDELMEELETGFAGGGGAHHSARPPAFAPQYPSQQQPQAYPYQAAPTAFPAAGGYPWGAFATPPAPPPGGFGAGYAAQGGFGPHPPPYPQPGAAPPMNPAFATPQAWPPPGGPGAYLPHAAPGFPPQGPWVYQQAAAPAGPWGHSGGQQHAAGAHPGGGWGPPAGQQPAWGGGPPHEFNPQPAGAGGSLQAENMVLRAQLAQQTQAARTEGEQVWRAATFTAANAFADGEIMHHRRATPAERPNLIARYLQAATDDRQNPVPMPFTDPTDNQVKMGTRVDSLRAEMGFRPRSQMTAEQTVTNPAYQQAALAAFGGANPFGQQAAAPPGMGGGTGDPLGDAMETAARRYAYRRNGKDARGDQGFGGLVPGMPGSHPGMFMGGAGANGFPIPGAFR